MGAALLGKMLPVTVIMFLLSLVMFVIIFKVVGVPLNGSFTLILTGTLLFILSYQSISVLIVSIMANLRLSLSLGGGYSVLAFTFSGLTFPIMAMYPAMRAVSKLFPFTYYTDLFRRPDAARGSGPLFAARLGVHGAFHRLTVSVPAASETSLHGRKILGEIVA